MVCLLSCLPRVSDTSFCVGDGRLVVYHLFFCSESDTPLNVDEGGLVISLLSCLPRVSDKFPSVLVRAVWWSVSLDKWPCTQIKWPCLPKISDTSLGVEEGGLVVCLLFCLSRMSVTSLSAGDGRLVVCLLSCLPCFADTSLCVAEGSFVVYIIYHVLSALSL